MRSVVRIGGALVLTGLAAGVLASAQQLPIEPAKQSGAGVTGSFEGWFDNPDGSHNFLVGYLNRNRSLEVDVPIGPNNRIEPGGPDLGQPTHFLAGRQVGMFVVTVPKEFTLQQRLTWTITLNGQTNVIPFKLNADYNVSPFKDSSIGNTPPVIRFAESGPGVQGPTATLAKAIALRTSMSTPLVVPVWADDDATYTSGTNAPMRNPPPPVSMRWSKFRGPGTVTFDKPRPELEKLQGGGVGVPFKGKGTTTVKFGEAGEYVLHLIANDYSGDGGGGEVCCWTDAMVKVSVTP